MNQDIYSLIAPIVVAYPGWSLICSFFLFVMFLYIPIYWIDKWAYLRQGSKSS